MIVVAGGVYAERCIEQPWDEVYGSGGRAAAVLAEQEGEVTLQTYRARNLCDGLENLQQAYGLRIEGMDVSTGVSFDYMHSLSTPVITPKVGTIERHAPLETAADVVLRFGMLEGDARVNAGLAVYDPQSAYEPRRFSENGSMADRLAIVCNRSEAASMTGTTSVEEAARRLLDEEGAEVVILKMGGHGALVAQRSGVSTVPAYKSDAVWKIGSGDVFSAAFTKFWALDGLEARDAADLASRATSAYCNSRSLPQLERSILTAMDLQPVVPGKGRVYIASPFFNLGERWLVEQARRDLVAMGVGVFSPVHDVGPGPGHVVAPADLQGLDDCEAVLAILNGGDAGTIFEVGYAVAKNKPVVALAQNVRPEDLKMVEGTGCRIVQDYVSAIYHAVWAL